jgi:hypothetical protein
VHVVPPAGHVHPVPAIETSVIPVGTVSVIVTVPLVGPAPVAFNTVTLYVAPFCPCVKFPVWLFAILNTGTPAWLTVKICPAIVRVPIRDAPVFAATA